MLALVCLGSGALFNATFSTYQGKGTGEPTLLRQLLTSLQQGDILLGDAIFENYFLLALLISQQADAVFEKNGSRHIDFRKYYKKLGKKDCLFVLDKPEKPEWMSEQEYAVMPDRLTIRAIKTKKRIIVTTLTDSEKYPRNELCALYLKRWHVELDLRSIKTLMKMDVLRCKSPAMVRKEIYVHLLVYNLIRALMAQTAEVVEKLPREVSFKAAHQALAAFQTQLLLTGQAIVNSLLAHMLIIIGEHQVGNRPGRSEPRAVKRRPKAFKKLQCSRAQARRLRKYKG